jgi:hypothetical protein
MEIFKGGALGAFLEGWKRFGKKLGDLQARALLVVFYFVIVSPFAIAIRCLSDPLSIKPRAERGWRSRAERAGDVMARGREQF